MRRRDFIKGITVSTAWPLVARAQPANVPVVTLINARRVDAAAWSRLMRSSASASTTSKLAALRVLDERLDARPQDHARTGYRRVIVRRH